MPVIITSKLLYRSYVCYISLFSDITFRNHKKILDVGKQYIKHLIDDCIAP